MILISNYFRSVKLASNKTLLLVLLLPLLYSSCKEGLISKNFDEGYIEYSIVYDDSILAPKFNPSMRPDKMVIKFKNNNTINKIEGLSGAFSFAFIQNKEDQNSYLLMKLLNKKLYYKEPLLPNSYPFVYREMPAISITKTNKTEKVLGYQCKVAVATFADTLHKPFNVYYTNEINIANPNANTPFEEIDGVMIKFTSIMFGHKMIIQANSIRKSKVSNEEFQIPTEYEQIDMDVVKDVIELLK